MKPLLRHRRRDFTHWPVTHNGEKTVYGDGSPGAITVELYDALTGIQNETEEDVFGWLHPLP